MGTMVHLSDASCRHPHSLQVLKPKAYKDALTVEDPPLLRSYGPNYNFEAGGTDTSWMGAWVDVKR